MNQMLGIFFSLYVQALFLIKGYLLLENYFILFLTQQAAQDPKVVVNPIVSLHVLYAVLQL